jgi:hypothetical protein
MHGFGFDRTNLNRSYKTYLRPQYLMWKRSTIKHVINVALIVCRHEANNTGNITTKGNTRNKHFCVAIILIITRVERVKLLIMTSQWRYNCRWLHQRLKCRLTMECVLKEACVSQDIIILIYLH